MNFRRWHILVVISLLAFSCRGPHKIDRDDMVNIYHDMFIQDQQLRIGYSMRRADTTLVYEGIFREYGYNTDDYIYSVSQYIKDPDKMAKMMQEVADRLSAEAGEVKRLIAFNAWRDQYMKIYLQEPDTLGPELPLRAVDSLRVQFIADSVQFVRRDSL